MLEFSTENVPFKVAGVTGSNLVDYLLIDLFFVNQTTGRPIQFQQAKLHATNRSHVFKSPTHEPFANPCSYRLTYVLTSAQKVVIDWQTTTLAAPVQTGTSTVPVLGLNSPFQGKTISLFPLASAGKTFQMASISATYTDSINNLNEQNSWSIMDFSKPPEVWNFLAPANKNVQIVSFDGTYVLDGVPYTLQSVKTSQSMLVLDPTKPLFSVMVDPSANRMGGGQFHPSSRHALYQRWDGQFAQRHNLDALPFRQQPDPALPLLLRSRENAEMLLQGGILGLKDQAAPALIPETALMATAQLTLPGKPPAAILAAASQRALAMVGR